MSSVAALELHHSKGHNPTQIHAALKSAFCEGRFCPMLMRDITTALRLQTVQFGKAVGGYERE